MALAFYDVSNYDRKCSTYQAWFSRPRPITVPGTMLEINRADYYKRIRFFVVTLFLAWCPVNIQHVVYSETQGKQSCVLEVVMKQL